jgi:hypothetical protein
MRENIFEGDLRCSWVSEVTHLYINKIKGSNLESRCIAGLNTNNSNNHTICLSGVKADQMIITSGGVCF